MRRFFALLFVASLVFARADFSVRAQEQVTANLYPLDTSAFPTVSALLDVFDARRVFVSGLAPEAVSIMEDGQALPVNSLVEQAVPVQLVVAVNQGSALDYRDTSGLSRFQRVAQVISGWAQTLPSDLPDDLSLVSQSGPQISHASAADFLVSLNAFKPDLRAATPNLQSLQIAFDTVSQQTPRPGMKRAILFITPHMDDPNISANIQPFLDRATQNNIRVFVWFVDLETFFPTTSGAAFNSLAEASGGSIFGFSGTQQFPDLESYFSPLRRVYSLSYASRLATAGQHTVSAQVTMASGMATSNVQIFEMNVQPPNPIFVSPPAQITRRPPEEDPFNTEALLPSEQTIEIIVEFPDQLKRPLTRTTLYVDGAVMDENTVEPFDKFTWDLSGYTLSGEHQMVVEAVDFLGLSKSSISIPVTVTVIQPPRGAAALLAKYRQPITYGAIAFAGLVLLAILLSGRVKFPSLRAQREARQKFDDPVTQPLSVAKTNPTLAVTDVKTRRRAMTDPPKGSTGPLNAPATFICLTADGQPAASNPIPLMDKEITFGTDPVQCNKILDDPSLSPLHARLRQTNDGGFLLLDNNSIAGTYVNYEPVPREGYRLSHGDMVHFGQLIYRFSLRTPPTASKPKIIIQKPEE